MGLGKLPVLGRFTIWIKVVQGPTVLTVGAGGGCLDIFTLIYPFSPLSPSLWETARYRLKHYLKGPLNRKQPTAVLVRGSRHFHETVFEGIAVFAVKQTNPARLFAQVLQDRVIFLSEDQTGCSAWRPEKASIDNIDVNAVEAEQSSMIYNVGSPINT